MNFVFKDFIVRPWKEGDQASLECHANNKKISRNLRDLFPFPYTRKDADIWVQHAIKEGAGKEFAIVVDNNACGGIGINPQNDVFSKSVEIGFWLSEEHWNKGILSTALPLITHYTFNQFDVCRIFALVFERNLPSRRVLEKCGFLLEGRLRKAAIKEDIYLDVLIYSLIN